MAAERILPIRVIAPVSSTNAMQTDVSEVNAAIDVANRSFKSTGLRFVLKSIEFPVMNSFVDTLDTSVAWSSIQAQIRLVFPAATYPGIETMTKAEWLARASYEYAPNDAIHVWSLKDGLDGGDTYGNFSDGPQGLRHIVMSSNHFAPDNLYGGLRGWGMFAHELGHYFGLPHTDVLGSVDPQTGLLTDGADFWDLYYKPGTSTTGHVFYTSRAAAIPVRSQLRAISRNDTIAAPAGDTPACSIVGTALSCDVGVSDSSWIETYGAGSPKIQGLAIGTNWASAPNGVNLMSYVDLSAERPLALSDSQIRLVRLSLEYDVPSANVNHVGSGRRPLLGQRRHQAPLGRVDFDGDGLRDIAMWTPALDIGALGEVLVHLSSAAPPFSSVLVISGVGSMGDIPVFDDYNADGRTDIGFYRPGGAGSGALTDASTWRWCPTASPASGTTCPTWTSRTFGTRAEVPLTGLRFFDATTPYLTVYNPATHAWTRRTAACTATPSICNVSSTAGSGLAGVPVPGYIDDDDLTDLVSYNPATATFTVAYSEAAWASPSTRPFATSFIPSGSGTGAARGGARLVRGLRSTRVVNGSFPLRYRQREALALWDVSTGNWEVDWDPRHYPAPNSVTCQWGQTGDIPLGGFGTPLRSPVGSVAGDAPTSLSVYRAAGANTSGTGYLHLWNLSSTSSCSGGYTGPSQGNTPSLYEMWAVDDMTGDRRAELLALQPRTGGLYVYSSDSGYVSASYFSIPYLAELQ